MSIKYVAGNPSACGLNPMQWILARPFWPIVLTVALVVGGEAAYFTKISEEDLFKSALVVTGTCWLLYWHRICDQFKNGDCNPGVVLSVRPLNIAVATDLSIGGPRQPALKVVEFRFSLLHPDTFVVGEIIPTTSNYSGIICKGSHSDFFPCPLAFGTRSQSKLDAALDTCPPEQIEELRSMLADIPKPQPRLYLF